jgi:hypothetical protein
MGHAFREDLPPLVEPVPIDDIFATRCARVERYDAWSRFVLATYERTPAGMLVARLTAKIIMPNLYIPLNMQLTVDAFGPTCFADLFPPAGQRVQ